MGSGALRSGRGGAAGTQLLCPVLVGREREMAVLRAAALGAGAGRGSVLLITGEGGVGKTRLLRELRGWCAQKEMPVLVGRAADGATATPFRPLAEALLAVDRVTPGIRGDPNVVPFLRALAPLIPAWAADTPMAGGPASLLHVAEGFLRVACACAGACGGAGAVVLLDDLQWADAETLEVIDYLADQVAQVPVMVVGSVRDDAELAGVRGLRGLLDRRSAVALRLERFTGELVVEMLRRCLGDEAVPTQLVRLVETNADGLPFFVEELLAGLVSDQVLVRRQGRWETRGAGRGRAPRTWAESVHARFDRLSPIAQELLWDAAMLGRQIELSLLTAVASRDPGTVAEAMDAALAQGLLELADNGPRFRHALTREALLARLPASARAERARRVLAAVRAARPRLEDHLAEVCAELAEQAGDPDDAAELLLAVARQALARGALASAESAQRRALTLVGGTPRELDVREALVATLGLAGQPDQAFPQGEVVLARLAARGVDPDTTRRRGVHLALARAAIAASDWSLANAHLDQLAALNPPRDPVTRSQLATLRAVVALGLYQLDTADRLAADAVATAQGTRDADLLCEALLVHGRCARVRDLDAAAVIFERARAVAHRANVAHLEARAVTELAFVLSSRAGASELLHEARRMAQACGAPETETVVELALAAAAWYRGDTPAQMTHGDSAARLARRYRLGQLISGAMIIVAAGHAQHGDREAMEALLAQAQALMGGEPNELIALHAHCHAVCALAHDQLDIANTELEIAGNIARSTYLTSAPPLIGLAPLMQALSARDPSDLIADFRARHHDTLPQLAALLAAAEAVQLGRGGDTSVATERMQRALDALAPNEPVQAMVARLVAPVAAADGWGDPTAWLRSALASFEARGLGAPAQACRVALRGLGDRVRYGAEELTARELDVLDLLGDGLSNRQIAARLVISMRTVEKHVERLLSKTGSVNRSQLATYALRRAAPQRPPGSTSGT